MIGPVPPEKSKESSKDVSDVRPPIYGFEILLEMMSVMEDEPQYNKYSYEFKWKDLKNQIIEYCNNKNLTEEDLLVK